jgi:UDP-glucose 4-epimerase
MGNPLLYYDNNGMGTLCLLEIMLKHNVKKIVFSSSCTVYGQASLPPYQETNPLSPACPYGWTKLIIEEIFGDISRVDDGWSVVLLRYFNPIGAHESGLLGEDPNGTPNSLVPLLAKVALGLLPELNVFGNDYNPVDGTPVRDYVHVMDIAEGHVSALRYCLGHLGVETVNLGTGEGYSVLQVVRAFEKASGLKVPCRVVARRPGDVPVSFADPSRANSLLGWKAKLDIDRMCADVWRFSVQNPSGLRDGQAHCPGEKSSE